MTLHSATFTPMGAPTERPRGDTASVIDQLLRSFADLDAAQAEGEPDPGADRRRALPPGAKLPLWRVRKIERFILANLDRALSLETLASQVHLSCSHFARACKNTLGLTPRQLVLRHRIERAQTLLRDTAIPLSQIALICGFADHAHFSRQFRQEVEATPLDWRRRNRASSN
jgi:AraC-like DNA-binding protein